MLKYSSHARIVKEAIAMHRDPVHYGSHESSDKQKSMKEETHIQEAAKTSATTAYSEVHAELGDHIKKLQKMHKAMPPAKLQALQKMHKAMDPAKLQASQKRTGHNITWDHVGDLHNHLERIKRVTAPD